MRDDETSGLRNAARKKCAMNICAYEEMRDEEMPDEDLSWNQMVWTSHCEALQSQFCVYTHRMLPAKFHTLFTIIIIITIQFNNEKENNCMKINQMGTKGKDILNNNLSLILPKSTFGSKQRVKLLLSICLIMILNSVLTFPKNNKRKSLNQSLKENKKQRKGINCKP